MTTQFNGVGFLNQPVQDTVPFITTDTVPQQFLYRTLLDEAKLTVPSATDLNSFFAQYSVNTPLPQDTASFSTAFATFYNLSSIYGANASQHITTDIVNSNEAAIQTNPNSFGTFGPQDADFVPLINPIGQQVIQQATFNRDMATRSFDDFLKTYQYTSVNSVTSTTFQTAWGRYYVDVANVRNNYLNIFTAFFANNNVGGTTDFQNALGAYIVNIMYPSGGSSAAFLPSHNYGDWMTQMTAAYEHALHGSPSTFETSIGPSVKGARILNTIFDLVVKMIATLQIVAAAQSDRLKFDTSWQQAYTNLEASIHSFVKSGPEWIQGDDDSRNQLNQANQTYTQEIQSRITVVNNDSKQLQTNINQSNDEVNQQTSLGTAIIQQLSSLLSAIYGASG